VKAKVFNTILLVDSKAFPGDVADIKRSSGPTENSTLHLKRNSVCRSIIAENNSSADCKFNSHQYLMVKTKNSSKDSRFKLDAPEVTSPRLALFFYSLTFSDPSKTTIHSMLTLTKLSGGTNNQDTPLEMLSSMASSSPGTKAKSLVGSTVQEIDSTASFKVHLRTLGSTDHALND